MDTFGDLPFDILAPILRQLTNRKDWCSCALVNRAFNRTALPFLYESLDSRIIGKVRLEIRTTIEQ